MENSEKLSIHEIAQTPQNIARLMPAFTGKAAFERDITADQLGGIGTLLGVVKNNEIVLTIGMTKRHFHGGIVEAVIVGAAGQLEGCDLVATIMPELEKIAKAAGCNRLSFQTKRRGLIAKAAKLGYRETFKTLRKVI
jgi:hypothetical protein